MGCGSCGPAGNTPIGTRRRSPTRGTRTPAVEYVVFNGAGVEMAAYWTEYEAKAHAASQSYPPPIVRRA